jgi:hypothetical protein
VHASLKRLGTIEAWPSKRRLGSIVKSSPISNLGIKP